MFEIDTKRYLNNLFFYTFLMVDMVYIVAETISVDFSIKSHLNSVIIVYIAYFSFLLWGAAIFKRHSTLFFILQSIPIVIFNTLYIWYLLEYRSFINIDTLDIVLNSNLFEAKEFFQSKYSYRLWISLSCALAPNFLIFFLTPHKIQFFIRNKWRVVTNKHKAILCLVMFIVMITPLISARVYPTNMDNELHYKNIAHLDIIEMLTIRLHEDYLFKKSINKYTNKRYLLDNVTSKLKTDKQTFIIFISESQGLRHFGVYGYIRDTTPFLDTIKKELYLFDRVKASSLSTNIVMQHVLSFADLENKQSVYDTDNIIEVFKMAGFKTYWVSNQHYLSMYSQNYNVLAYNCDDVYYTDNDSFELQEYGNSKKVKNRYDMALLPKIDSVLKDTADKKLIFIHIMGSHIYFKNRYPIDFGVSTDSLSNPERSIIEYDNTIRYTDYFLQHLFYRLKNTDIGESYLLFFSDHAEDVFDTNPNKYYGRGVLEYYTDAMYDIPFFVWINDEYKHSYPDTVRQLKNSRKRRYQIDRLPHTIIELSQLNHNLHNSEDSIISRDFIEKPYVLPKYKVDK